MDQPTPNDPISAAQKAEKLNTLFADLDPADTTQQGSGWERMWADGRWLPWERRKPNPALEDTLLLRAELIGSAVSAAEEIGAHGGGGEVDGRSGGVGRRKKALVPGCGRGYDVCLLRAFGWDATGLEISDTARRNAEEERGKVDAGERLGMGYEVRDDRLGLGSARFVTRDFFEWGKGGGGEQYDLIYDYTFLSALPPSLRPRWSASMQRLLAPGGRLVCVEFPADKDVSSGGPPWGLPEEVYVAHLGRPGEQLPYGDDHKVQFKASDPVASGGFERIARWRPERTHEAGKGRDWVSVWKIKS